MHFANNSRELIHLFVNTKRVAPLHHFMPSMCHKCFDKFTSRLSLLTSRELTARAKYLRQVNFQAIFYLSSAELQTDEDFSSSELIITFERQNMNTKVGPVGTRKNVDVESLNDFILRKISNSKFVSGNFSFFCLSV